MISTATTNALVPSHPVIRGEPVWDIALLYPPQGDWTEEEYLGLDTNRLIEFVDGCLEVLPMPMPWHQLMVAFLFEQLRQFVERKQLGSIFFAPVPVRLFSGRLREPDIIYARSGRVANSNEPLDGADLVMEIVSEGKKSRTRDLITKRLEYAKAKVAEYWTVDPAKKRIVVLRLSGKRYRVDGEYRPGSRAASALLPGFGVDVAAVLAAGKNGGRLA